MSECSFEQLVRDLGARAASATLSQLSPASEALRLELSRRFAAGAGQEGSFISDPVFESLFEWERHDTELRDLEYLDPDLVDALDRPGGGFDVRFQSDWCPYLHQHKAWSALLSDEPRSVLVSTGTASGKTECFLVPVLQDLVRRSAAGPLEGVHALFLYPLNALINSQRERLYGWTSPFGERVRFSLYNSGTPQRVRQVNRRAHPNEVLDRDTLRESPPPVLVTNATMLEYMLIRKEDAPIVEKSRGKLRWIVLDEAHTYVGAAAAEVALLLRRVMSTFDVSPNDVRFVATSATIGEDAADDLSRYLANLAGVPEDRVDVITGRRVSPSLGSTGEPARPFVPELESIEATPRGDRARWCWDFEPLRDLRVRATAGPLALSELVGPLRFESGAEVTMDEGLRLTNLLSDGAGEEAFLPLRGHLMHRTQAGLWACSDSECPERRGGPLEGEDWGLGAVYFSHRNECECGARVYELVFCNDCGQHYLHADLVEEDEREVLRAKPWPNFLRGADGEQEEDFGDSGEEEPDSESSDGWILLYSGGASPRVSEPIPFDPHTGAFGTGPRRIRKLLQDDRLRCARCDQIHSTRDVIRPSRLGAPFYLGVATPTLLERLPGMDGSRIPLPSGGRRTITFSDSRQGTARFAARSQLENERNVVRSFVYHKLWSSVEAEDPERAKTVEALRSLEAQGATGVQPAIDMLRSRLEEMDRLSELPRVPWDDMVEALAATSAMRWLLQDQRLRYLPSNMSAREWAELCLYRELLRRPTRQTSLETLGFASVRYPKIEGSTDAPREWTDRGLSNEEWVRFLELSLDFVVRARTATRVDHQKIRWMGTPFTTRRVLEPGAGERGRVAFGWPIPARGRMPRVGAMLCERLGLDPGGDEAKKFVEAMCKAAYYSVVDSGVLAADPDGYYLEFDKRVEIQAVREAHFCPLTRRVLDKTLSGVSPYLPSPGTEVARSATPITMPKLPYPFGRKEGREDPDSLNEWLAECPEIAELRRLGAWIEFSDRIARSCDYISFGEHSAQLARTRLQDLERKFKAGKVNVLSCSTTMEMGVDIGGLVGVGMNNVPPGPANYLQRAGRAGRRGQARAVCLTMCASTPHGQAAFERPRWPFDTPVHVPTVSLQSDRIVQRHINALALSEFLRREESEALVKQSVKFFVEDSAGTSVVQRFQGWLDGRAGSDERLCSAIDDLKCRTVLEPEAGGSLLAVTLSKIREISDDWTRERHALLEDLKSFPEPEEEERSSPERSAVLYQLKRMENEYLLAQLCSDGFLPSHGFPLGVVPFVHTTAELIAEEQAAKKSQDDELRDYVIGSRREYPSLSLSDALREYAPGSVIVLDRHAYRSEGLVLNWHIPPSDTEVREVQSLRYGWRCKDCGRCGTDPASRKPSACRECESGEIEVLKYLEPSGFAVDIRARPSTDVSEHVHQRIEPAWISVTRAPWDERVESELVRMRHDSDGLVFHHASGAGKGYALCLECGRAAAMELGSREGRDPRFVHGHDRLRRGSKATNTSECSAGPESFKILRGIRLGGSEQTDVFELQLRTSADSAWLEDPLLAQSIAVALRGSVARILGVDEREIAWSVGPRTSDGRRSVLLSDAVSGGAGYVAEAIRSFEDIVRGAREILDCDEGCDRACHCCLLSHDTREMTEELDRLPALTFLEEFSEALEAENASLAGV